MGLKVWIRAGVVAVIAACMTPTGGCGCTPRAYSVHFVGFVLDSTGAPLSATVTASYRDRSCAAGLPPLQVLTDGNGATNADGRYRLGALIFQPDTVCARVVARSAAGTDSSVRDNLVVGITGYDTLRMDFSLRP